MSRWVHFLAGVSIGCFLQALNNGGWLIPGFFFAAFALAVYIATNQERG